MRPEYLFPAAAIAMNGAIAITGWTTAPRVPPNPYIPPGWFVGSVWVVLFALLGWVYGQLKNTGARVGVLAFTAFCLAYPVATSALSARGVRFLNLLTLVGAFSLTLGILATGGSRLWMYCIPLLVWASYVNATDVYACFRS
jgi:hypothetical protein